MVKQPIVYMTRRKFLELYITVPELQKSFDVVINDMGYGIDKRVTMLEGSNTKSKSSFTLIVK